MTRKYNKITKNLLTVQFIPTETQVAEIKSRFCFRDSERKNRMYGFFGSLMVLVYAPEKLVVGSMCLSRLMRKELDNITRYKLVIVPDSDKFEIGIKNENILKNTVYDILKDTSFDAKLVSELFTQS